MKSTTKREKVQILRMAYEPGNATRYELVFVPPKPTGGPWLIALPYWGTCIEVSQGTFLALGYLREKIGVSRGRTVSDVDLLEIGKAIAATIKCECETSL